MHYVKAVHDGGMMMIMMFTHQLLSLNATVARGHKNRLPKKSVSIQENKYKITRAPQYQ